MSTVGSVLVAGDPSEWLAAEYDKLRLDGFTIDILFTTHLTRDEAIECLKALGSAHYSTLVTLPDRRLIPLNQDVFRPLMPGLRYVSQPGAGYDEVDIDYLTRNGAYFVNGPVSVSHPTAITATMLILQVIRAASQAEWSVRQGRWQQGLKRTPDIRDLTLGVIGLGTIGKLVQRNVEVLGMNVIYYNRHRLSCEEEGNARYVTFDELISTADVITLHTPLTDETHHMLSDVQFSRMKDGVFIVNTSRGPVIHEEALVRAMQSGKVSRVGLDVYEHEPIVHPWLMQCDRASLLPHWAAYTNRNDPDSEKESLDNLKAWLLTGKPKAPVNSPRI
ncbi:hypothetical protein K439DRAFT_1391903 [Ramaria rubella]|nr:hypothetical protein K439DRAFT_1391903 [Ramaria rubella]